MKYHFGIKLAAFLLAACMLVVLVGSGLCCIYLIEQGLYTSSLDSWKANILESRAWNIADHLLRRYTATELGDLTREQLQYCNLSYTDEYLTDLFALSPGSWDYWITDLDGRLVESNVLLQSSDDLVGFSFTMSCDYPIHATPEESRDIELTNSWSWRDYYYTETEEHFLYYFPSPTYRINIRVQSDAALDYWGLSLQTAQYLFGIRYLVIAALVASLLLFVLCMVYLCFAAGRSPKYAESRVIGLNRLPLDIYLAACVTGCILLGAVAVYLCEKLLFEETAYLNAGALSLVALVLLIAALLVVCFLYALAAQSKQKNGHWWRCSVIGWCLRKIGRGLRFCFRGVAKLFRMLPLIWQWLATAAAMFFVPLVCLLIAGASYGFFRFIFILWTVAAIFADIGMVCYGAYAFGVLIKGANSMAQGNLHEKVPTKYLFGAFRDFADALNSLADAAVVAAKNQMKSERMKTELITNVSHDIKTPLTSIINYVDLLQSPHTEEQGQQYLEVLSRQSARMKKLVEDLMDMSKASSGNLQVNCTALDAVETINQALGEFTDKLTAAHLTPIFQPPEKPVMICADGRHTWRVLSNLLSNTVKYAMPGTRVYIDLIPLPGCVQLSLKNISREPLNVSADELTERFVRGDASRNTEGSGLGLNIAKSLMELQKGSLELLVDGDLFKVTLTFPTE